MKRFEKWLIKLALKILNHYNYEVEPKQQPGFDSIDSIIKYYNDYKQLKDKQKNAIKEAEEAMKKGMSLDQAKEVFKKYYKDTPHIDKLTDKLIVDYSKILNSVGEKQKVDNAIKQFKDFNESYKSSVDERKSKLFDENTFSKIPPDGGINSVINTLESMEEVKSPVKDILIQQRDMDNEIKQKLEEEKIKIEKEKLLAAEKSEKVKKTNKSTKTTKTIKTKKK
jgi:hypothetical protein